MLPLLAIEIEASLAAQNAVLCMLGPMAGEKCLSLRPPISVASLAGSRSRSGSRAQASRQS